MTKNKLMIFLLIIASSSIVAIDKEKKWWMVGLVGYGTTNFLMYQAAKKTTALDVKALEEDIKEAKSFLKSIRETNKEQNVEKFNEKARNAAIDKRVNIILRKEEDIKDYNRKAKEAEDLYETAKKNDGMGEALKQQNILFMSFLENRAKEYIKDAKKHVYTAKESPRRHIFSPWSRLGPLGLILPFLINFIGLAVWSDYWDKLNK